MKITVNSTIKNKYSFLRPFCMLDDQYAQRWFQMYDNYIPINTYFLNCGMNEKNVICFWFDDEDQEWKISTDDEKGLNEYNAHMSVRLLDESDHPEITIR